VTLIISKFSQHPDQFHTSRLLPIEQKPFSRITKRLLSSDSLISKRVKQLPSPPPNATDAEAEKTAELEQLAETRRQWREEFMIEFGALESSMARIQLLYNSNERERRRYAEEKIKIMQTAEAIKNNTTELRTQLEEARNIMQTRKTWDALAETILKNQTLKSREDQEESMKKTNAEIADEDRKAGEFGQRWAKRREQFMKIVDECKAMQAVIKEEDEEPEAERKDRDEEGVESGAMPSAAATPAPDAGGATPLPNHDGDGLKPLPAESRMGSRAPSPGRRPDHESGDVSMGDAATPAATHSSLEEGEEGEASETNTPMEQ
jgi:hypothetical protein